MHAIYERITVAGREIVSVRLTVAASAHGLALALPEAARALPSGGYTHVRILSGASSR